MNTRNLASLIESYLEADDGTDTSNSSSNAPVITDSATRQKVGQLMQVTDQLKQDNEKLKQQMAAIKNNLQMSALLPLLTNQSLTVLSEKDANGNPLGNLNIDETIQFKPADILTAMLPVLMMGGFGGDSGGGGSDNSSNMLLLALAISGKFK